MMIPQRFPMMRALPVLIVALALCIATAPASAYDRWSVNDNATNCRTCHGNFRDNNYVSPVDGQNWGDIHDLHRNTMLSGDCSACHLGSFSPVMIASSNGGDGLDPIGCMGCHGRVEDTGPANPEGANGYGAGLRQHHDNAGITLCRGCHQDAVSGSYTPVGEHVLPPYYADPGQNHPNIPADACNADGGENFAGAALGQDNDGDGVYDDLDSDCITTAIPGAMFAAIPLSNEPNPFNPRTTIRWNLPTAADVDLRIYDVSGQLVRTLLDGAELESGSHDLAWNGTDERGERVSAGVYFYHLSSSVGSTVGRMVMVK